MGTKHKDDFEPYWQDEKDWLCIVEFLPSDNPEARLFAADIIGYLVGYANLTNTRSLALLGDPDASAYELLFSFSSPGEKNKFLNLVRSNEYMGNDYIIEFTPPERGMIGIALDGIDCVGSLPAHRIRVELCVGQPQKRSVRHVEQAKVLVEERFQFGLGKALKVEVHDRMRSTTDLRFHLPFDRACR